MKVSVIIPAYNCEEYIQGCIESVLDQKYPDMEVIVVDDGSTDSTHELLDAYADTITVFHQKNAGSAGAINTGIELSDGDLIAWVGADDEYLPDRIKVLTDTFERNPNVGLLYTDYLVIDENGEEQFQCIVPGIPQKLLPFHTMLNNHINFSTVMVRRSAQNLVGIYDPRVSYDCDGDIIFRLLKAGVRFMRVPMFTVKYRQHSEAATAARHEAHLADKDTVRTTALKRFTTQELLAMFPENRWQYACEKLSQQLERAGMPEAAKEALRVIERIDIDRHIDTGSRSI